MVETIVGILATALTGTIGWAVKTSSKVAVLEQTAKDIKELAESEQEGLKELIEQKFDFMDQRLARIETCLNGKLRGY